MKDDLISKSALIKALTNVEVSFYLEDGQTSDTYDGTTIVDIIEEQQTVSANDGWIPCSERLPNEKKQERTVYDPFTLAEVDVERYMISDLVNVTVRDYDRDEIFVCDDCTVDGKWVNFDGETYEVIAWQPLPKPYKEKGK